MPIQSLNPATGDIIKTYEAHDASEIDTAVGQAQARFQDWKTLDLDSRIALVRALVATLKDTADANAQTMTMEMGKTLTASHAELDKCIKFCNYNADNAGKYLTDTPVKTEYKEAYTRPFPLGVILLVMPWNFPFWQVLRVAIPAILAGNTCLLKHASNVPGCALALENLFTQSGFPKGVFQTLLIGSKHVEGLLADTRVAAASLTGSEAAGSSVAATCGKYIKKCVLELGGSDPFIVMPSADLSAAIDAAFTSRMRNNGQSCIAAKRLIVHADIYDDFKMGFLEKMNDMVIGDPLDPATDLGPLSSQKALQETEHLLMEAIKNDARATPSDHVLPKHGYYIRPGIFEGISPNMELYHQEIFAPVVMLFKVGNLEDAITLANDTPFGLSSVLFSNKEAEHNRAITALQAGSTFINRYASSDIRLPFGGIRRSGYGREMAREGMLEFTNIKTVIVAH